MNMPTADALVSWSGGKDSCLALWRAQQSGMRIARLITALDESGQRARSHGVPPALLQAQADALGVPLAFYSASWQQYEEKFIATLRTAHDDGIRNAVFGDIDLQAHRDWEEKVCATAGLQACLPLWDQPRQLLVEEFLTLGFKAVVVCVNGNYLSEDFCGREFDAAFLADLPANVDACGENGEFHTFVYDGPAFAQAVPFRRDCISHYQSPPELGSTVFYFQELLTSS
ncbi:diphthine--ammonia ligase [Collimonas sp. NPDC087041]|uniref:Dph6-related ATP pyrophosphatase n=1 Tax=Collimonas sp. NPDC087041 TaxID=3363960 RepID=UPI003809986A